MVVNQRRNGVSADDRTNRRIVSELQADGRQSYAAIGKAVPLVRSMRAKVVPALLDLIGKVGTIQFRQLYIGEQQRDDRMGFQRRQRGVGITNRDDVVSQGLQCILCIGQDIGIILNHQHGLPLSGFRHRRWRRLGLADFSGRDHARQIQLQARKLSAWFKRRSRRSG